MNTVLERVKVLEGHKDNLDEHFKIKSEALDLKIEQAKKDFRDLNSWVLMISGAFLLVGIGGIWSLFKYTDEIAKRKVEEKLEASITEFKDLFLTFLNSQKKEVQLREQSRIIVISKVDTDDSFLKRYFDEFGFKNVVFHKVAQYDQHNNYDLIFFNNENGKLDQDLMNQYISQSPKNVVFFYYGSHRVRFDNGMDRITFANSRIQIYSNLINGLRYYHSMK